MVRMLSLTENLHTILRVLYDDMMALCYPMSQVAMAIAGIGALLYIAYRVWQSMAQAEPIDLFPLMRPFAIGICILFFPTLVLGSLNGILSPLVKATHSLMAGQTLDMEQWQERRERLELEGREQMPPDSYYAEDEEMERELNELGVDDWTQQTLDRMNEERSSWSVKGLIFKGLAWLLELLFAAASVILDVLRTFYLVVLSLLGPIAFAISVFDGFQSTLTAWIARYVGISLWLPVSDLFGAMLSRLQTLMLSQDIEQLRDPDFIPDGSNTVYCIFMIIGIVGYFCVPTVASWIIQAGGAGSYGDKVAGAGRAVAMGAAGVAGVAVGNVGGRIKGALKKR